jgi:cytochrome c oxidase subunit IV
MIGTSVDWLRSAKANAPGVGVAVLAGVALVVGVLVFALSRSPTVAIGSNGVALQTLAQLEAPTELCQAGETVPAGASGIRVSLFGLIGPRVTVRVLVGGRVLASGQHQAAWTGGPVTVPVHGLGRGVSDATVCVATARARPQFYVYGERTVQAQAARFPGGRPFVGRVRVEYVRPSGSRWWSLIGAVADRMGLGRAWVGVWVAPFVTLTMLGLALLSMWLIVREGRVRAPAGSARLAGGSRLAGIVRRVPFAAWACALVACANAVCWSFVTPPFQIPDEPSHFSYVQVLVERGALPSASLGSRSPAEDVALDDLRTREVNLWLAKEPISTQAEQRKLEEDLAAPLSRRGPGGAGVASGQPPLYYALEAIPYELGSGGTVLDQLQLMRLLSALMAGVTALFAYLFVREALPGRRLAWAAGGLAVALFPLLGSISGGLNPDAMLFAVCAVLYYCLARGFRRGLSRRLAVAIGLVTAVGFLTKLNFIGFAPAVLIGVVVLAARTVRSATVPAGERRKVLVSGAVALSVALAPVVLVLLARELFGRQGLSTVSGTLEAGLNSPLHILSYMWQLFLPRLPGMTGYFPGVETARELWFDGLVGEYGWSSIPFQDWVNTLALVPVVAIVLLAARGLLSDRDRLLESRGLELAVYGLTVLGMLTVISAESYVAEIVAHKETLSEARYLLPLLALWGLLVAVAVRGAGHRLGAPVAILLVSLLLAHDLVSELQVVARFYG